MWNFIKLLGIGSYEIISISHQKEALLVTLKSRRKTARCIHCNIRTDKVKSYGKEQKIKHGSIYGKTVYLLIRRKRFFCQTCCSVFSDIHPLFPLRQRATIRHKKEVISNLADRSFSATKKHYCVSYPTQRKWLNELVQSEVFNFEKEEKENTPFVLGIDEVSFSGRQMVTTVGNITKHRLKGVLHSKRKDELQKLLKSLSPLIKSLVSEVVIDMCPLYLMSVKATLPQALVVVDHFHIIQDANKRIDGERVLMQDIYKKRIPRYILTKNNEDLTGQQIHYLAEIMKQYPELLMFYQTKERLRDMYKSKTKEEAEKQLRLIISTLSSTDDGELISWGRTLTRWKQYILNYWNSRSTNGFMEGMHNKMKLIKRISFGFRNKDSFIQKVMLSVLITTVLLPYLKS